MSSLKPGVHLGPYEIEAPIGAGGMGEVYRAHDTRLNRNVAIKVLPQHISEKPEAKQRFKREAEMIAAMNHPHICTLYDVGEQDGTEFLVMELIEGETLAARLGRGRLPMAEILEIAIQTADALHKAHRQGIVHRDLKPNNVMLTSNGIKLLDFGLAKLRQPAQSSPVLSAVPTNADVTAEGAILGTIQYMAPEQLEGQEADARTDIFAFGAIVYELLSGKKAFQGKSQVSLIGAILEREPMSLSTIVPETPTALSRIVHRCLAKDPDDRWQSIGDIAFELKSIAEGEVRKEATPGAVVTPAPSQSLGSAKVWIGAASIAFAAAIALGILLWQASWPQPEQATMRFFVTAPDQMSVNGTAVGPAISPDGKRIAFVAINASGRRSLWIRQLDALVAQQLPGTEDSAEPFWSPDSRSIAFVASGKLKRIDVAGGPPINLCDAAGVRGGTWNRDGVIVFAPTATGPLFRVSSGGGQAVAVTKLSAGQGNHRFPSFLPDGDHFLYFATSPSLETQGIYVGSLRSGESKRLLSSDASAIYAPPGYLLFVQNGVLMRKPFDATKLEVGADAVPVAESVAVDALFLSAISVSDNGTLVYRSGSGVNETRQLASYDRTGKLIDRIGPTGRYIGLELSPDGKQLAVHRHDGNGGDIWLFELMRGTMSRFTFDASQDNSMPIWSPDGKRIVFSSFRNGKWGLYQKESSGSGKDELLYESAGTEKAPMSWSPDDKYIVFEVTEGKTAWDLWVLPLTGERKAYPFMQSPFNETWAVISPNGKWIAYDSDETGRYEVYIRPFPSGDGKWPVSANGGWYPRWQKDGKELFYADGAANGKIISVRVNTSGQSPEFSPATPLFDSGYININHGVHHKYAVSPDGQRFIIPRAESALNSDSRQPPITVVLNWDSGLKKK